MSDISTSMTKRVDSMSRVWDEVSARLEAFAQCWEGGGDPPSLQAHLPVAGTARRLVLNELIKIDLDYRLNRGIGRTLESYIAEFPDDFLNGPPCDLMYEDIHLRRRAGVSVDAADYYRRFPNGASELARLLGTSTTAHTTSIAAPGPLVAVQPGDQLDDFDLLTLLGRGQFAKVFLARQRSMQRLVALKVSAARGAEAQTLAQLDHQNIVRVYDQRQLPDRGLQLVYMPYLPGGTLLDVLDHANTLPAQERSGRTYLQAVDAALQNRGEIAPSASPTRALWASRSWPATVGAVGAKLAAALDYAHDRGVMHRDVKPANVLLTADGEPLLADFNVGSCSKLEGAGPSAIFGGSLPYMSPEHLEAFNPAHPREPDSLDGRADQFGLAVTLWELLTGQRPFDRELRGQTWPEMLTELVAQRHMGPTPESMSAAVDGDTVGLREVLLGCLDPDPGRRPATAADMAFELELCLQQPTRQLLRPAPGGWREFARRMPFLTLLIAGLTPNALAALFSIQYNSKEIIGHWPAATQVFANLILAVNAVFFPLGVAIFLLYYLPLAQALRQARTGARLDDDGRARGRCLRLGAVGALICVGCWVAAGLVWPVAVRLAAGPPPQGPSAYVHFLLSLVICGLIAAAYPYFLITFVAVRVWYPALLAKKGPPGADAPALKRIERELARYRAAATAVPLLAVAMLASRGAADTFAVAVLCVTGLAGTILAFALEGRTRADLAALSTRERA